jgi:hypothetical protein
MVGFLGNCHARSGPYGYYWTTDFGDSGGTPSAGYPYGQFIFDGSHETDVHSGTLVVVSSRPSHN